MSPESKAARKPKFSIREFVYRQNGSCCLTPNGRLVLELIRNDAILSHDRDPENPFAISGEYREKLLARRTEIAQTLGLDFGDHATQKRIEGIGQKIQKRTGIAYHQITF